MNDPETLTILVTGGAGFIASHVAEIYVAAGHRVHVLDDLSSGRRENVPERAALHELDIRSDEAATLIRELRPDVLSLHAAQMDVRRSTEDPRFDADVNILGTLNLLEASVEAGVGQVIFASTGGAIYGEQDYFPADEKHPTRPVSPYGVSKLACERYLYYYHVQHGLDVTCLRYANVYGERQNPHGEAGVVAIFLNKLLRGEHPVINGDGLQTRDYVHVSNIAQVNLLALGTRGFELINIGTGRETSVVDLANLIAQSVGSQEPFRHGPAMAGEQQRSCIDASKLRELFGIESLVPVDQGLESTAKWFIAQS